MNWLDIQTSLYATHFDNIGRPATFRDILMTEFAVPHKWYNPDTQSGGKCNDIDTIVELRKLDSTAADFKKRSVELKAKLQGYTPAALLKTKKKGAVEEINRTAIMQLDFDRDLLSGFLISHNATIEDLKKRVFDDLPWIAFCGLSCSGSGFYALALISESQRLSEYAERCFDVFQNVYGIQLDTSKGKKPENLRYVSYDANMLIRDYPEPLTVPHFKRKEQVRECQLKPNCIITQHPHKIAMSELKKVAHAQKGQRFTTLQQAAYTLGGLCDPLLFDALEREILANSAFAGEESQFLRTAKNCFEDGARKPIIK